MNLCNRTAKGRVAHPLGPVEKVSACSCGRSCESVSTDLCDLPPLPNMYLRVRSQSRLHGIKT